MPTLRFYLLLKPPLLPKPRVRIPELLRPELLPKLLREEDLVLVFPEVLRVLEPTPEPVARLLPVLGLVNLSEVLVFLTLPVVRRV